MEVRPGYKVSEVGVIPEKWETRQCSDLCERIMVGIVIRPAQYYVSHGIPAFRSANVREDGITDTDLVFISEASNALLSKSQTRKGDVLTVRTGYPGTSAVVRPTHAGCNCIDILITRPTEKLNSDWLAIWINSSFGKEQVLRNQGGLAQKHFNVGDMRNLVVALPPVPEQRAIAAALCDVDTLVAGLDRLIAKKRDIKQAAMQQLLTGQTRLPGFQGEWELKRLGESLTICHGKNQRGVESPNGLYPILATGGRIGTASRALYDKPSVLIGRKGTINQPRYMETPFWTVDTLFYSVMKGDSNAKFLYYRFCLIDWMQYNEASGVPSLNARTIENVEIATPLPAEQAAIAAVLSDMDAELTTLEARRDKTRALKQGMMQELLTGRTRLV